MADLEENARRKAAGKKAARLEELKSPPTVGFNSEAIVRDKPAGGFSEGRLRRSNRKIDLEDPCPAPCGRDGVPRPTTVSPLRRCGHHGAARRPRPVAVSGGIPK